MFANYIKLIFVVTAYSPIIFILWIVNLWNVYNDSKYKIVAISNFEELFNILNIVYVFIFLIIICWIIMKGAQNSLTVNPIEVKSIKSADFNMGPLIASYFLPCLELIKKDIIYMIGWIGLLLIMILILRGTYFYNPILKLFGYRYYEIATKREVTYIMISKEKLINSKNITAYSQLTDYIILNNS